MWCMSPRIILLRPNLAHAPTHTHTLVTICNVRVMHFPTLQAEVTLSHIHVSVYQDIIHHLLQLTQYIWATLIMTGMVFAFDINKHVLCHFFCPCRDVMWTQRHRRPQRVFCLVSDRTFTSVMPWRACAASFSQCVRLYVCVCIFSIQHRACGHASVERSVSLTDRWEVRRVSPARSSFSPYLYHTHTKSLYKSLTGRLMLPLHLFHTIRLCFH